MHTIRALLWFAVVWYWPIHDDVIKWKHFPRYWPFVRGNDRSPVIPRTKASDVELWCFSLICVWINGWVNNHEGGDLRRYRAHYDVTVMFIQISRGYFTCTRRKHPMATGPVNRPWGPFDWHESALILTQISNHMPKKCVVKLLIYSQTSTAAPLKIGNK